jgi:hypothetical protein
MSAIEFRVGLLGGDVVFPSRGRKPQALAELQLAVFVHRLAHGHDVKMISRLVNIPGESRVVMAAYHRVHAWQVLLFPQTTHFYRSALAKTSAY